MVNNKTIRQIANNIVSILKNKYNLYDVELIATDTYQDMFYIGANDGWYTIDVYKVIDGKTTEEDIAKSIYDDVKENDVTEEESITNVANVVPTSTSSNKVEESNENLRKKLMEDADSSVSPYPSLLVALDSEKDAIITYETLIDIEEKSENKNQDVIDLLTKILTDEKEHIALLSALQAKNNEQFVADDAQETFNTYIEDIDTSEVTEE